jgi:hypothetical protein
MIFPFSIYIDTDISVEGICAIRVSRAMTVRYVSRIDKRFVIYNKISSKNMSSLLFDNLFAHEKCTYLLLFIYDQV